MATSETDATIAAIATWTGDAFNPPWSDYIKRFAIDEPVTQLLIDAYCNTNSPKRLKDIDLARLNFRRSLCQLRRIEVVQATLDDPPKRLYRDADFPLICAYLGEVVLSVIISNYEGADAKDAEKRLILRAMAQMMMWNASSSSAIAEKLGQWLANFPMQNCIFNGFLIAVARLVPEPPSELSALIEESKLLTQYFDDQQTLQGLIERTSLFSG